MNFCVVRHYESESLSELRLIKVQNKFYCYKDVRIFMMKNQFILNRNALIVKVFQFFQSKVLPEIKRNKNLCQLNFEKERKKKLFKFPHKFI